MITTADEELSKARDCLRECIGHLSRIVVEKCHGWDGHDGFNAITQDELVDIHAELLRLRVRLDR
jgi:hypothetical protein